jgi:hypothetical protein
MPDGTRFARVKRCATSDDFYLELTEFSEYLDTEKVDSYEIKVNSDKTITIKFYDKAGKNLLLKK